MKANETTDYAQMGIAALLPGMQHMLTLMQGQLDEMRAQLARWQSGGHKKLGRPRKIASGRSGWPEDPEERSREMRRRMAVAREKKHHVRSAGDRKRRVQSAQRRWENMSERQRKQQLAKMQAGRWGKSRQEKVNGLAAVAS